MAARALITLFRSVNPRLLARKDRGRPTDGDEEKEWGFCQHRRFQLFDGKFRFLGFARPAVADFVPGAEVLEEDRKETGEVEVDEADDGNESLEISGENVFCLSVNK